MNKREFLKTAAVVPLVVTVPGVLATPESKLQFGSVDSVLRRQHRFPNTSLVDQDGNKVKFYDDLIKGKTVMINFMYTACADICPMSTSNLKKVYEQFGNRMGKDIYFYSVTIEPEKDTPAQLKAYKDLFKIGDGWKFLTGRKEDIEILRKSLGFVFTDPALDNDKTQHLGMVKYGIEPLERWGMAPVLSNPQVLVNYVMWMEPTGSRPLRQKVL